MKIRYCIVTLNQLQWVVDKHLPSVDRQLVDSIHLHVSEAEEQTYNGQPAIDLWTIDKLVTEITSFNNWHVSSSVNNYGVANAWNLFIEKAEEDGYDAVIIANDDIYLYEGTLARFVQEMESSPFVSFIGKNAFSFFGIHIKYAKEIGPFDEQFWPAYYEDNDFHYRMKLRGFEGTIVDEPSYFHAGSATLGKFEPERKQMHHHNFQKNTVYYIAKWGGLPGDEFYTTPFNDTEGFSNSPYRSVKTIINGIEQDSEND